MAWSNSESNVYLIAEIGGNHEGDFEYAKRLTELACASGADAVKFQIYTGDSLVSKVENPVRNEHFKKFELEPEQHIELAKICQSHGVEYNASVWDMSALDWIDPYLSFYKIGSGDFTAYPVLQEIVAKKKPILLSTGLSTLDEIKDTVNYIIGLDDRYAKPENLAILQCTSMYPIPASEANLDVMLSYRSEFDAEIGYSDHTEGSFAVETAISMGAKIIEFHFTDTREGKEFRDHKVSFTKEEVQKLKAHIDKVYELKGSSIKEPTKSELEASHLNTFRRAVYLSQNLSAGEVISKDQLTVLRPNVGIDAREFDQVIGKKLVVDKQAFAKLDWSDFE